ncbi:MAG: hypothetical protein HYZ15_14180 [Sphingobacteriales bacterium]|nr:hypothetical protein [Sphingobacteriales bacterium]
MNHETTSLPPGKRGALLSHLWIGFLCFFLGGAFVFFIKGNGGKPQKADEYSFTPVESLQKKMKDGGTVPRTESETFTGEFLKYMRVKEPDPAEFDRKFTAATWYSMTELENYFKAIKDETGLLSTQIRIYVCPAVYSQGTTNPYNQRDVSGRMTTTLAFFQAPFTIFKPGTKELYLKGNPNCLGLYNWGDLEP